MDGIVTEGLCKHFGEHQVLNDLSFRAPAGEITLLAGLNGAGKTTWVRAALGLARSDGGSVSFDGEPLSKARPSVTVVLDEPPVYPNMSGRSNLRALSCRSALPAELSERIASMLALTPSFLALRGSAYSLGQRRRLAMAAALLREPRFLFLDEPTIALDPVAWGLVRSSLRKLAEDGCAVVLTGQDFGDLADVVTHVAILRDGRAVWDGSAEDLTGIRPPRVWFERLTDGQSPDGWIFAGRRGGRLYYERACSSRKEAGELLQSLRSSGVEFMAAGIAEDSLKEAFLALVGGEQQ